MVTAYTLKGEKERINLFEQKRKYYSPFIGREKELQILRETLKNSFQSKGQIIEINGELGIGKSRLILELTNDSLAKKLIFYPLIAHLGKNQNLIIL